MEVPAPEIISASRSTDIPAFYADWFFHRLETGFSASKAILGKKDTARIAKFRIYSHRPHGFIV